MVYKYNGLFIRMYITSEQRYLSQINTRQTSFEAYFDSNHVTVVRHDRKNVSATARCHGKFVVQKTAAGGSMELDTAKLPVFLSDFKMLTLASETSIYVRTAEINFYYLMTLSVLRYAV